MDQEGGFCMRKESDSMNILRFISILVLFQVFKISRFLIPDHRVLRVLIELGIYAVLWFAIDWINQPFSKIVAKYRLKDYHVFVAGLVVLFVYALWT